ncbi:MAG TPA: NAD(P)-dependent oxidoreductase [Micromonosporaceae bacterium]|nr:NAD(P)-dependent oxidoreductase [Micromonosporaceae bacterium]
MTDQRTVLLAGASGVFGRRVAATLSDAGYTVLGLGRGEHNEIRADLNDRDQVMRAVRGRHADIVVHAATALAKPPMRNKDMTGTDLLRTTGMHNLVDAAHEIGAKQMISESMAFGYGFRDFGSTPVTEETPFAPRQSDPKLEEHVAAMRVKEQLTFGSPGIDGVALRFGLFYGPDATDYVVTMLRKRMLPAITSGHRVLPWVHLDDAAAAVLAAIERGRPGSAYNIADDTPMSFANHTRAVAAQFHTPKPLSVPAAIMPMSYLRAFLKTNLTLSNERAASELGWRPRYPSAVDGLAALAREAVPG